MCAKVRIECIQSAFSAILCKIFVEYIIEGVHLESTWNISEN